MGAEPLEVDVQKFIDDRRISTFQWVIIASCSLMAIVNTYDIVAIGFAVPLLIEKWHISKAALGPDMSLSIGGMAVGALLAGPLIDRTSPRSVLVGAMLIFSVRSAATTASIIKARVSHEAAAKS
ncbi:MFS transporter [Sphingosinicella soli]|uniref:MFS family permease n=1 Tax=Sphingosinicella soli TaxID=333708 RepID=A0A7W7B3K2_9SPHN|nr:MFS transporter [Sphingosinicella soli]MBB4633371.1 MFS family permease [Sphingosinicella soli]